MVFPILILSSNRFSIRTLRQRLSPFVLSLSKYERTLQIINGLSNPLALSLPKHRQRLFPFVLSLSKYERTLRAVNALPDPDSFFESFFNPYPSTSFLRQAQDG
ncbi:MAG: hypothetical protein LBD67_04785, partial [Candidatus Accumulibacter sp.]|nr:hypothetical protein [Accumulibacter sp.]